MNRRVKPTFRQTDIFRLLKGAEKAGKTVKMLEIDVDGRIIATFVSNGTATITNPWDDVLK